MGLINPYPLPVIKEKAFSALRIVNFCMVGDRGHALEKALPCKR